MKKSPKMLRWNCLPRRAWQKDFSKDLEIGLSWVMQLLEKICELGKWMTTFKEGKHLGSTVLLPQKLCRGPTGNICRQRLWFESFFKDIPKKETNFKKNRKLFYECSLTHDSWIIIKYLHALFTTHTQYFIQ